MVSDATGSFNVVYGKFLMNFEFGSRKREEYGTENGGGTGLLYGQTRGGRTHLDVANQHPTCPRAPVSFLPHPMHLMHPFPPRIPLDTPLGLEH